MFRLCAGDAAPGSSQTAFGSGSLLLAPLSNFRAGTLPTTVPLPHSLKPETNSLPACLAARTPSLPPSASLPWVSVSLFPSLPGICLPSIPLLFFCLCLVLCLQDYRSAVLLTACKSHCALPLSLISSLPLISLVCVHLSSTHCGLVRAVSTQATFPF